MRNLDLISEEDPVHGCGFRQHDNGLHWTPIEFNSRLAIKRWRHYFPDTLVCNLFFRFCRRLAVPEI